MTDTNSLKDELVRMFNIDSKKKVSPEILLQQLIVMSNINPSVKVDADKLKAELLRDRNDADKLMDTEDKIRELILTSSLKISERERNRKMQVITVIAHLKDIEYRIKTNQKVLETDKLRLFEEFKKISGLKTLEHHDIHDAIEHKNIGPVIKILAHELE